MVDFNKINSAYARGNYDYLDDYASSHYNGCREGRLTVYISRKFLGIGKNVYLEINGLFYSESKNISNVRDIYVSFYVGNTRVDFETIDPKEETTYKTLLQNAIHTHYHDIEVQKKVKEEYNRISKNAWFS